MGCACNSGRKAAAARAARGQEVFDFTAPGSDEVITYGTILEARAAVRTHGGGSLRRRFQTPAA